MRSVANNTPIMAVIYDLDGVLVSTDEYHYKAWKRMADEENIPFDRHINERLRGVSRMESLAIILERSPKAYTESEKAALAERKNGYYVESLKQLNTKAVLDGARETVLRLKEQGLAQAVASSSKNAPLILRRTELGSLFDAAIDGTMISHSKPDPEVFAKAAAALGVVPARCIVVEDAVSGVQAGNAAGMRCFAVGSAAHAARNPEATDDRSQPWKSAESLAGGSLVSAVEPFLAG